MSPSNNEYNGPQKMTDTAAVAERITEPAGTAGPAPPKEGMAAASTATSHPSNVERAENITHKVGEKTAHAASACVRGVAWLFISAREAQNVWAETQSIRGGDKRE
jgi:hypothetical protein